MPLKEKDLRKVVFNVPSESLTELVNTYFSKRYLNKSFDSVLDKLESKIEEEGFDMDWLEALYERWEQEQPSK